MNPYFQDHYFKKHTLNKVPNVELKETDSMMKENYEMVIHSLFREASMLNHQKDPCDKDFIPDTKVSRSIYCDRYTVVPCTVGNGYNLFHLGY